MKRLATIIFALIGFYSFGQVNYVGSGTTAQIDGLTVPSGRSALVYNSTLSQYGFKNSASLWYWLITEADIDTFAELDAIVADKTIVNTADSQTLTNKTISGASNTLSDIPTTALSNGDKGAITVTSGILTIDTGAVTTSQILDGTIVGVDISDGAVGGAAVLDGSLTGADIADGFITEVDLNASVNASLDLADSAVQPGDNISTLTNDAGYITSQTDDQTAAEVSVAATPSNYTAATADVEAHLAGIDTALGSVGGGSGDVVGPASATDNAIARFDGTTGKLLKSSSFITFDGTNFIITNGARNFRATSNDFEFTNSSGASYISQAGNQPLHFRTYNAVPTYANRITIPAGTTVVDISLNNNNLSGVNNITATGDLTVTGGDINSTTSLDINLDTDNNGTESYNIVDGAGTTVFSVSEAGALTMSEFVVTADSIVAPNLTTAEITATSGRSLITKEYFDANIPTTASEIAIVDSGALITATDVEGALAEIAAGSVSDSGQGVSASTKSAGASETYDNSDITVSGGSTAKKKWNRHTANDTVVLDATITLYEQFWIEQNWGADSVYIKKGASTTFYTQDSVAAIASDGVVLKNRDLASIAAVSSNVFFLNGPFTYHQEATVNPWELDGYAGSLGTEANATYATEGVGGIYIGLVSQLGGTQAVESAAPINGTYSLSVTATTATNGRLRLAVYGLTNGQVYEYSYTYKMATGSNGRFTIQNGDLANVVNDLNLSATTATTSSGEFTFSNTTNSFIYINLYATDDAGGSISDRIIIEFDIRLKNDGI